LQQRKPNSIDKLQVNIVTPDNNVVINPIVPLPNQKRMPAFERFGGQQPFGHHTSNPDNYFGNDIDDQFGS